MRSGVDVRIEAVAPDPREKTVVGIYRCGCINGKAAQQTVASGAEVLQLFFDVECRDKAAAAAPLSADGTAFHGYCEYSACAKLIAANIFIPYGPFFFRISGEPSVLYIVACYRRALFLEKDDDALLFINLVQRQEMLHAGKIFLMTANVCLNHF